MMNKMMKKLAVAFAAATMMITAVTATAFANDGGIDTMNVTTSSYEGLKYVTASSANVRENPSTDSRILKAFDYGTEVWVDGYTSNGWYRLFTTDPVYGGECCGYIAGNLLSDYAQAQSSQTANTNVNSDMFKGTGYVDMSNGGYHTVKVADGYLALRTAEVYDDSNIIGALYNGEQVFIDATTWRNSHGYFYVYAPSLGMSGFVNAGCIE